MIPALVQSQTTSKSRLRSAKKLPQPKQQSGALDSREPPLSMTAQTTILPNASAESWQNPFQGECPTGFYRFPWPEPAPPSSEKRRLVRGLALKAHI
jgi:hypothetical protein